MEAIWMNILATAAICLRRLRDEGLPVTAAWSVPEAAEHMLAVSVARDWPQRTERSADNLARRIAEIVKAMHGGQRITRVMVCDDDIDVTDMRDLMWAWNSRCHPANGHFVLADQPVNPIESMYAAAKLSFHGDKTLVGPIEVLNCLLPTKGDDLLLVADFATNFPKDLQERVIVLWDS
nr:UbiD family decarboxylase domain-containing protein [Ktedonobacter racemifer]